jgi:hypothetical protein
MILRPRCLLLLALWASAATAVAAESVPVPSPEMQSPAGKAAMTQGSKTAVTAPVGAAADRLDLDASVVTGNRELPKVLYIVPWKKAEVGDLPEQPFNSLLDEALKPVDRDVFRREVAYYTKIADRPVASGASGPEKSTSPPTTRR